MLKEMKVCFEWYSTCIIWIKLVAKEGTFGVLGQNTTLVDLDDNAAQVWILLALQPQKCT